MSFPFAALMEKEDLIYLGSLVERYSAKAGACLWREGDLNNRLGLVIRGQLRLTKEASFPGHSIVLGLFGAGALVVDLSFAQGRSAETSAYAVDELQMVFLARKQFEKILAERPQLGNILLTGILYSITDQLRHMYRRLNAFF